MSNTTEQFNIAHAEVGNVIQLELQSGRLTTWVVDSETDSRIGLGHDWVSCTARYLGNNEERIALARPVEDDGPSYLFPLTSQMEQPETKRLMNVPAWTGKIEAMQRREAQEGEPASISEVVFASVADITFCLDDYGIARVTETLVQSEDPARKDKIGKTETIYGRNIAPETITLLEPALTHEKAPARIQGQTPILAQE